MNSIGNDLTDQQNRFVEEYLYDLNGTQAAIRAGYSPNSAESQANRLLRNAKVSAAVSKAKAAQSRRTGINNDRVIRELAKIAFANAGDIINMETACVWGNAAADDKAAIASVKVKSSVSPTSQTVEREVKLHDKIKALDLLGKHLGLYENAEQNPDTEDLAPLAELLK